MAYPPHLSRASLTALVANTPVQNSSQRTARSVHAECIERVVIAELGLYPATMK